MIHNRSQNCTVCETDKNSNLFEKLFANLNEKKVKTFGQRLTDIGAMHSCVPDI